MFDILVIEDNPADLRLLGELLRQSNVQHGLKVLDDPTQAIEMLAACESRSCPDLVILGLTRPGHDAHGIVKQIRSREETRHVPVVVMSASDDKADVNAAYESYANCYLVKPATAEDWSRVIHAMNQFWFEVAELPKQNRRRS